MEDKYTQQPKNSTEEDNLKDICEDSTEIINQNLMNDLDFWTKNPHTNKNVQDTECTIIENTDNIVVFGDSEKQIALFDSFSKYIEEVQNPENTAYNKFLDSYYSPLNEVLNTIRPIMGKYGLSLIQAPYVETFKKENKVETRITIKTIITHSGGAYISFPNMSAYSVKNTLQDIGATITYLRRFSANSLMGVSGEIDNDGNEQSSPTKKTNKKSEENKLKKELIEECANYVQNDSDRRKQVTDILKTIVPSGNVNNIRKEEDFNKALELVRNLKENKENK